MAGFPPAMVSGEPCLLVQTQFPHLYSEGSSPTTPIFLQRKLMSVIGWGLWPLLVQALLVSSCYEPCLTLFKPSLKNFTFFFNMILDPGYGSGDQNRGFSSLIAPLVLSVRDFKIRVKGLGKLSLLSGYASALGLSQSLALNLPLALTFLWVLGRGPASKGRGHEALPKWEPRRCRGIAASV